MDSDFMASPRYRKLWRRSGRSAVCPACW